MMAHPPRNARLIALLPLDHNVRLGGPSVYVLASGERFWFRMREHPQDVEVFVYRPFFARLKDAWGVQWGEPRR